MDIRNWRVDTPRAQNRAVGPLNCACTRQLHAVPDHLARQTVLHRLVRSGTRRMGLASSSPAKPATSAQRRTGIQAEGPAASPVPCSAEEARDPDWWRRQACASGDARATAQAASREAYLRGDHSAAKAWSNRARDLAAARAYAHDRARQLICSRPSANGSVDLHGLTVSEALDEVRKALERAAAARQRQVVFIYGRGLHSRDGVFKLGPAVDQLLTQLAQVPSLRIGSVRPGVPSAGCVTVQLLGQAPPLLDVRGLPEEAALQEVGKPSMCTERLDAPAQCVTAF